MLQRMAKSKLSGSAARRSVRTLAAMAGAIALASAMGAQAVAPGAQKPHKAHKPHAAKTVDLTAQAPVEVPQPETPKWPANEAPGQPTVTWNSLGLHIQASNSSLSQILNSISTQTGAKIEGVSGDERVFGEYGPGTARDVLAQLLRGSNYNFLLLGDQGQGTPRQVILTARRGGGTGPGNANRNGSNPQQPQDTQQDEDPTVEQPEPPPEEPPQPVQPPPQPLQQQEPMNPQQRMQLMQQQRLQQMQQLQQQYQQQQQQQPQEPQPQPQPQE